MRRLAAVAALLVLVGGCSQQPPADNTPQESSAPVAAPAIPSEVPTEGNRPPADDLPPPAEPQKAPPQTAPIPGRTVPVGTAPEGVVVDAATRTVAVAARDPNELVLLNADTGDVVNRVPLPGFVRHLQLADPGGPVLVPVESANALVRVELPSGRALPQIVTGVVPHDASEADNGTVFVANEHGGTVTVLRGEEIVKVFADSVQPAGLAPVGRSMGLIDVRKNDLTVYDTENLRIVGSTPAGEGPTHLVADKHGRMIAADTRGDAIRVFEPLPTPRQIGEVAQPGGPYGIAYDPTRDLLWVASSGTNEVVGYDMSQPTPREVKRLPTVQDPYTLGVDATTGRLFIAGVSGGVVQIVDPQP
ncbi:MAG TPA: YncE family protein [Mycobacterium sp.]|jgi:DNA-binding beta-propeller fold protein YncE|nr:YncE family protein [Mycobacterium sp.]